MLDKLKAALTEIRRDREDDLRQYKVLCGGDKELISKRRAILTLELPFKVDTASVMYARAACRQEAEEGRESFLGIQGKDEIVNTPEEMIFKRVRKQSKKAILLIKEWMGADPAVTQGRRTVWNLLKDSTEIKALFQSPENPKGAFELVAAEDLIYILSRRRVEQVIENIPDVGDATKTTYRSHATSLLSFLSKGVPVTAVLTGRKSRLSLESVAALLEFLENRALKSSTLRAFHDIVLVRAIFYAPIAGKDFFELSVPNDEAMICIGERRFPVPQSFLALWRGLPQNNVLLERSFDEKQLNKKLRRFGEYAVLHEIITPSTFRLFARSSLNTLHIDEATKDHLPRR